MSTFLERLQQEQKELNEKLEKLGDFIVSENFEKLSKANKMLLRKQCSVMNEYNEVLILRLELLSHN